jgi:hypothetical protein
MESAPNAAAQRDAACRQRSTDELVANARRRRHGDTNGANSGPAAIGIGFTYALEHGFE